MKIQKILLLVVCLISSSSYSQRNFPLKVAISNESTAIPFSRFFTTPIHPTIQFGTEYFYTIRPHSNFYQTGNLGYIFHNHLYQGIFLNTGVGYDYIFDFGLKLKANLSLGYLHTFTTQDEFQLSEGEYVNGTDWGNARSMTMLSLGLGYIFKRNSIPSSELFFLYNSWVEYPYSPGFIPLMTHINLELGYKQYINWHHDN